jgi:outer membrane lipoprotein SlyB
MTLRLRDEWVAASRDLSRMGAEWTTALSAMAGASLGGLAGRIALGRRVGPLVGAAIGSWAGVYAASMRRPHDHQP